MMVRVGLRKMVAFFMIIAFSNLVLGLGPVQAAMVQTQQMLSQEGQSLDKQRLMNCLESQEVQDKLISWGVDPSLAKERINSLTDQELATVSRHLETLPAGGDGLGVIVGAAVLIFLVLLLTDILGLTDVFNFVRK